MQFLQTFAGLFANFGNLTWQMVVMWVIGGLLIYLAIAKKMEPSLLLPMGFGAILVNLPLSGAITQGTTVGPISALFDAGMSNELFPLLLFIGIGAMIDFGPLLEKPWLMLFGAAAQFGIFVTLVLAGLFFDLPDAASIAVIGAADGPTAIFVANTLGSKYLGAIMVAAYSYMALVPIVQPPVIRLNDRFTVVEYGKEQANISAASRQQKSVIASSTQESAPSVLDGNPSTAWKANKGEYITFALENNASPNNIAIAWKEKSKDAKFEIQLSGGGGQFLTVYEGTVEATNELTNYRFKGTTASDIRIVITSGNASISEVKIKELKN